MTVDSDIELTEKYGNQTGIILISIENLSQDMIKRFESGEKRFDAIENRLDEKDKILENKFSTNGFICAANTEKLNVLYGVHLKREDIKVTVAKFLLKKLLPAVIGVFALGVSVIAGVFAGK